MMKTSFTKLFRERWKALVPFLFFCAMSLGAHAEDFAGCGNLDSISRVTITVSCNGNINVSVDMPSKDPNGYMFSGAGFGTSTFNQSLDIPHGTTNLDSLSGRYFQITEQCSGTPPTSVSFFGIMPDWLGLMGPRDTAATYTYTDSVSYDGKSIGTARPHDLPTNIQSLSAPTITYSVVPPSCSNTMDGIIRINADLGADDKCATNLQFTLHNAFPGMSTGIGSYSFNADGNAAVTGLGVDTFFVVFGTDTTATGCICNPPLPDTLMIAMPTPNDNDASLSCINEINVSSSIDPFDCDVTIRLTDVSLNVNNPCNAANSMAEYIIVKDNATGRRVPGRYLDANLMPLDSTATQGFAFRFDAHSYFGRQVKVEVHDSMSGNYCWGLARIEDKAPPVISCDDPSLRQVLCVDFRDDVADAIRGRANDCNDFDVTVVRSKEIPECNDTVLKQVQIVYFAEDEYNNRSVTCNDTLQIMSIARRTGADNNTLGFIPGVTLHAPPSRLQIDTTALNCHDYYDQDKDGAPDPVKYVNGAGHPYLTIVRDSATIDTILIPAMRYQYYSADDQARRGDLLEYCKISAGYEDILIGKFNCITKYMRNWTVYHWACNGEIDTSFQQIIEIVDTIPPSFRGHEVPDSEVSVNTYSCSKVKEIKMPTAWDNCTPAEDIEYQAVVYDSLWNIIGPDVKDGYQFEFPYGRNYVVYSAFDACHREARDTAIVDVIDRTSPVVGCKKYLVVGISADGTVRVPVKSFDNYSYDDCGLKSLCVVRMDDQVAFDSIDAIDAYANDGWVLLSSLENVIACNRYEWYATHAVERTIDKDKAYYLHRDALCQQNVWFCCADDKPDNGTNPTGADNDVQVIMRAEDYSGNRGECMVWVDIQDKTRPSLTCPADVTVDCDVPMPAIPEANIDSFVDIANDPLTALFGTITREHFQEKFGLHPSHIISPTDHSSLVDGVWFDNCDDPRIFVRTSINFDQCRTGHILRTFYAEDASGNRSNECTQRIDIESQVTFDYKNIIWPPADTILNTCMSVEDITATMFGVPRAQEGACVLFGTSYKDDVFRLNNRDNPDAEACFKLIRTWKVDDWCGKTPNGTHEAIVFKQVIKVIDREGPSISCGDVTPIQTQDCDGATVELTATSFDECTPSEEMYWDAKVDLNNDGTYEHGLGSLRKYIVQTTDTTGASVVTITRKFPIGVHKIIWVTEDRCGNSNTCETLFTVSLTKAPTPFAVDVSTVLMSTGMVAVWATDLDNKSEGACNYPVKVGVVRASADTLDGANIADEIIFTCEDFLNGPRVPVHFYAYQTVGGVVTRDYTTVHVTLQDNHNACDAADTLVSSAVISGKIRTASSVNVQDVEIGLLGGNQGASALGETKTNRSGVYAFPAMARGGAYVIDPISSNDYLNGVSTLDLVLIQRYVLGLRNLDDAYQIIASDINNDGKVSAADIAALRSTLLGRTESFKNNDSWRFLDATYRFEDESNPLAESFPEEYSVSALNSNMEINFVGIKVGDIDGSVDAAGIKANSRSVYTLNVEDQSFTTGELVSVAMRASSAVELLGLQFTSTFDANKLAFAGVEGAAINIASDNIGLSRVAEGIITASWHDIAALAIAADDAIVTVNFKALADGTLSESFAMSSAYTAAEMYNTDLQTMAINMAYNTETTDIVGGFELYQNTPNPFAEITSISFYLPKAGNATLKVYDVTGKVLKLTKGSFDRGLNTIKISKRELASSGVLYYTLETAGFTDTKRMVVLK